MAETGAPNGSYCVFLFANYRSSNRDRHFVRSAVALIESTAAAPTPCAVELAMSETRLTEHELLVPLWAKPGMRRR
jgi:hypothetical protein